MTTTNIDIGSIGLWTGVLDQLPSSQAVEWAAEAESLAGSAWESSAHCAGLRELVDEFRV